MELRKYLTETFDEDSLFQCNSCDGFVLKVRLSPSKRPLKDAADFRSIGLQM